VLALRSPKVNWRGILLPASLLLAVEISASISPWNSDSVAPPSEAARELIGAVADGSLFAATGQTLLAALGGCALGLAIGFTLGFVMGLLRNVGRALDVSVELVRPIPAVAVIPLTMLVLGLGFSLEITVVAFACIWPALVLSRSAIGTVDAQLFELARTLELSTIARVMKIVLPATLPLLFVAVRISVGIALIVAITVEIAANPLGLGYHMMMAQQTLRPGLMYGLLAWIAVLGWSINALMLKLESLLTGSWDGSAQT
jgi:ABC-type nitrate/sulfonate/bicarbonate transport system permease component